MPLLRRMAVVLRAEGGGRQHPLQSHDSEGEKPRSMQRRRQAKKVVERFQWIGAGVVSVTPLPVVDLLATAAVNAQMVVERNLRL